jgi:hypothetical protein
MYRTALKRVTRNIRSDIPPVLKIEDGHYLSVCIERVLKIGVAQRLRHYVANWNVEGSRLFEAVKAYRVVRC